MAFIEQPLDFVLTTYRPIVFVTQISGLGEVVNAFVRVIVQQENTGFQWQPTYKIQWTQFSAPDTYTFHIDISEIGQGRTIPFTGVRSSIFGTVWEGFTVQNLDCMPFALVQVQYEYRDPVTGLIELDSTQYQSNTFRLHNSVLRPLRPFGHTRLNQYYYPMNLIVIQFLTEYSGTRDIGLTEHFSISFMGEGIECMEVERTNFDTTTDSDTISIANFLDATDGVYSMGVGPINLMDAGTVWDNAGITIDENTDFYTIQLGTCPGGVFGGRTFQLKFQIDHHICEETAFRLHWLNNVGGTDAYTFKSKKNFKSKLSSNLVETPLGWKVEADDYTNYTHFTQAEAGRHKYDSQQLDYFEIASKPLSPAQHDRLIDLSGSPEVYYEVGSSLQVAIVDLIPVTIRDSDEQQTTYQEDVVKEFIVEMGNLTQKHRR